jgi:hypothetical protein
LTTTPAIADTLKLAAILAHDGFSRVTLRYRKISFGSTEQWVMASCRWRTVRKLVVTGIETIPGKILVIGIVINSIVS